MSRKRKLAIEADNYEDAMRFAEYGADIIQCEKFDFPTLAKFVTEAKKCFPNLIINAAGGINADNATEAAATGVDVVILVTNRLAGQNEPDEIWIYRMEELL